MEKASTGNNVYDKEAVGTHEACVDDGTTRTIVEVPGEIPQQRLVFLGKSWVHKSEDEKGRWVYASA